MWLRDSINAEDRELMKRLTIVALFVFVFTAAFAKLHAVYSEKFFRTTGQAQWIWAQHRMSDHVPLAFFAAREFELPERRRYTHLKLLGDPEYTLWFNGRELTGRRIGEERQIDFYDLSELAKTGRNRIVVAVRAPQGVGGLIAAIDIGPEAENWIITDASWRIYRRWHPEIPRHDVAVTWERPMLVGEPPVGRWNYLTVANRTPTPPPTRATAASASSVVRAFLPTIRTRSGVAVAVADPVRATAFDFGPHQSGRVRLSRTDDHPIASRAIPIRFANIPEELTTVDWTVRPVVFAPGEKSVTTPETYLFRYVLVYGRNTRAEVVR